MTGAGGGGVGAGTRCTGFGQGSARAAVETGLALLAVGSLDVALTVQTHSWRTEGRSNGQGFCILALTEEVGLVGSSALTTLYVNLRLVTGKPLHLYAVWMFSDWCCK